VLQDRYISVRKGQQQKATNCGFFKEVTSDFEKEFSSVELVRFFRKLFNILK
jgi:hypothetical protein